MFVIFKNTYIKEISWKTRGKKKNIKKISQGIWLLELPDREFILFIFIDFYLSIIALQYWGSFCSTANSIRYIYM